MNATSLRSVASMVLLFAAAAPLAAVEATSLTIDCTPRSLPSQRQVGDLLGLHNLGQTYAARTRLMAVAARACQNPGTQQVKLVLETKPDLAPQEARRLAKQQQSAR